MIREAVSKDIKPLTKLLKEYGDQVSLDIQKSVTHDSIRNYIAKDNCFVAISKDNKEINGVIIGAVMSNGLNTDYVMNFSTLYVANDHKDPQYCAKALLTHGKNWAGKRGLNNTTLTLFKEQDFGFNDPEMTTYKIV